MNMVRSLSAFNMSQDSETQPIVPRDLNVSQSEGRSLQTSSGRRKKLILVAVVFIIFLLILGGLLYYFLSRRVAPLSPKLSKETDVVVETDGGRVRGTREGDAIVFKGIPYGRPPVGALRWKPPMPCLKHECWNGTLNASAFGSFCTQPDWNDLNKVVGSEDCLFLNIWAPDKQLSGNLFPVVVYIHGGSLSYASGDWSGLHPNAEFVNDMKVVGVSFNYRLNAFGFLALDSLTQASPNKTSGNYGFMDQILVLQWIQRNIKQFGGDSQSVTVLGHSSGGTSQLALLSSPLATGLFHRAIVLSASAVFNKSLADASRDNEIFVKKAKCERANTSDELDCLYNLSPEEVENAIPWYTYPSWQMVNQSDLPTKGQFYGAIAVVDGVVVPEAPLIAMATGKGNDVPVIFGTVAQEDEFLRVMDFTNSTFEEYESYAKKKLEPFLGNKTSIALTMYNHSTTWAIASPQYEYLTMASDIGVTCPNEVLAFNASIGFENPVYRYIVTNKPSRPVTLFGLQYSYAFHIWDLISLFGFPDEIGYKPSEKDKAFMQDLRREFKDFINTGRVHSETWKTYPEGSALFTDVGIKTLGEEGYHKKECEFWLSHGFFSYGWIN